MGHFQGGHLMKKNHDVHTMITTLYEANVKAGVHFRFREEVKFITQNHAQKNNGKYTLNGEHVCDGVVAACDVRKVAVRSELASN